MKYSIPLKFFVILITALALVLSFFSALGIVQAVSYDLYTRSMADWAREQVSNRADSYCMQVLESYVTKQLTTCSPEELSALDNKLFYGLDSLESLSEGDYRCTVYDETGAERLTLGSAEKGTDFTCSTTVWYPVIVHRGYTDREMASVNTEQEGMYWVRCKDGTWSAARYASSPLYTAKLLLQPEAVLERYGTSLRMVELLHAARYLVIITLAVGLLIFAAGAVYLCWAAGRSGKGEEITPGGLNRLPLDLYLAAAAGLFILALMPAFYLMEDWYYRNENFNPGVLAIVLSLLTADAVIFVGFCFACAAQFKARNRFWWNRSVIGWVLGKLWKLARLAFRGVCRGVTKITTLVPLLWKWLLVAGGMGLGIFLAVVITFDTGTPGFLLFVFFCCFLVVLYGGYAFGTLLAGAKRMAEGNLSTKINTRWLVGDYKKCAGDLNALADVAVVAAKNQMKSDRMKTELITNVSHDIKTPLTSIINYVDLLEKPHTEEEGQQYLEVLHRQSLRMKKLVEDLMDMSKAATGNMSVEITRMDAAEAVNQALGEFADKLALAQLTPVFRQPEEKAEILADGRLTWRVLSNLLGNAVKYALPGTRLYVDLARLENHVVISLKNISREELNVSADELTERFVRGDASRNTEGSGLGLNIAQSLMELQKGQLQLLVDGDLFKVTLLFPRA